MLVRVNPIVCSQARRRWAIAQGRSAWGGAEAVPPVAYMWSSAGTPASSVDRQEQAVRVTPSSKAWAKNIGGVALVTRNWSRSFPCLSTKYADKSAPQNRVGSTPYVASIGSYYGSVRIAVR